MIFDLPIYVLPIIFEGTIVVLATIILVFTVKRYLEKRNKMTILLLSIFLFLVLAILTTTLGDIFYYIIFDEVLPINQFTWFLERFMGYRLSFVFVVCAMYSSYLLMVELFGKEEENTVLFWIYTIVGIITGIFVFVVYEWGNFSFDIYAFGLVFVYMAMVYIRFMIRCWRLAKRIEEKTYRTAINSLSAMSFFIILVFMSFLLDRILISLSGEWYSIFYYLAWTWAFLAIISAYYGYIRPKSPNKK